MSSYVHVVHTTAKQVISRRRKNENVFKMSKDEKCTCKACKNIVFHCRICKFVRFLFVVVVVVAILTSSSYHADAPYLWQQLGWKDLITQRQIQETLMVFKALNDLAPDHLFSMFTKRTMSSNVFRDPTNKLNVTLPRTNYLKRSFSYRGATSWNSLPCNFRQEKSLNRFKQLLNFHFS